MTLEHRRDFSPRQKERNLRGSGKELTETTASPRGSYSTAPEHSHNHSSTEQSKPSEESKKRQSEEKRKEQSEEE
jgi:ribosomal protein L12E/L44/L45/RPP1/RPP2